MATLPNRVPTSNVPPGTGELSTHLVAPAAGGYEVDLDQDDLPAVARAIIEEIRRFEITALRLLLTDEQTDGQRPAAMVALLRRARSARAPYLTCRAVERAEQDWAEGAPYPAWYWRAAVEEGIVRDVRRGGIF